LPAVTNKMKLALNTRRLVKDLNLSEEEPDPEPGRYERSGCAKGNLSYRWMGWDGIQPNCVKMEEALDLYGNRTDTERWVGHVCAWVCVCTGMRVRKWRCSECVWKRDLSKIYVNKKEKGNCVCVCVCVCGCGCGRACARLR